MRKFGLLNPSDSEFWIRRPLSGLEDSHSGVDYGCNGADCWYFNGPVSRQPQSERDLLGRAYVEERELS